MKNWYLIPDGGMFEMPMHECQLMSLWNPKVQDNAEK